MKETQEDRYYRAASALTMILGEPVEQEAMNRIFFEVIEPLHSRARMAEIKLGKVQGALTTLLHVAQDEVELP